MENALQRLEYAQVLQKEKDTSDMEIILEIRNICSQLDACYQRFEYELDNDLVESCIYEMEALKARYRYLLKTARDKRITCPMEKISSNK